MSEVIKAINRNSILSILRVVSPCVAVLSLAACAMSAAPERMIVTQTASGAPFPQPFRQATCVRNISGGEETNPMWTSKVGNAEFSQALASSLQNAQLLGVEGSCRYFVDVNSSRPFSTSSRFKHGSRRPRKLQSLQYGGQAYLTRHGNCVLHRCVFRIVHRRGTAYASKRRRDQDRHRPIPRKVKRSFKFLRSGMPATRQLSKWRCDEVHFRVLRLEQAECEDAD